MKDLFFENNGRFRSETLGEILSHAITHGIGAGLSIAGLVLLVVFASMYGDGWRVGSLSVFGATLVILYLSSTLYHSLTSPRVKRVFRKLDHISVYLLIAGTYTPLTLVLMRDYWWGWVIFGLVWALAIVGILLKVFWLGRFEALSLGLYLGMGWLVVVAVKPLLAILPEGLLGWLLAGGCCYTVGVVFYCWEKLPYNHAIWHLFVLGGSASHFFGALFFLTGR